jgi:hypothetical protein
VDEDARLVVVVERVAAHVRTAIDDEDALVEAVREALGHDGAGIAGSHDEIVEHGYTSPYER